MNKPINNNKKIIKKIHRNEINLFLRQVATLLNAGVPIIQSLDTLAGHQNNLALANLINHIKYLLNSGHSLQQTMQINNLYFDDLTCHMIGIGEKTGKLAHIFNIVSERNEKLSALYKSIQKSLFYPLILFITSLFIFIGLMLFIVPQFALLLHDTSSQIPLITQLIFSCAAFMHNHIGQISILCLLFIVIFLYITRTINTRRILLSLLIKLPITQKCIHQLQLAFFANHLVLTCHAGIPIIDGLKLLAESNQSTEFTLAITKLRYCINTGMSLHHAMLNITFFPPYMLQLIKTGEESGTLESMLVKAANLFQDEAMQTIHNLSQLLEPLIILILGALIGVIVVSMYLPIFKLGNTL